MLAAVLAAVEIARGLGAKETKRQGLAGFRATKSPAAAESYKRDPLHFCRGSLPNIIQFNEPKSVPKD